MSGRLTVGEGDAQMLIEVTGAGQIKVSIPSGKPIVVDSATAEEMRMLIATAIGMALDPDPTA